MIIHRVTSYSLSSLFLKYGLFTMADWDIAKRESPTLRKLSTTERTVGSVIAVVSGLRNIQGQAIMRHRKVQALTRTQTNV